MIRIKPVQPVKRSCPCGGEFAHSEIIWQGLHICEKMVCANCNKSRLFSFPVNQSEIEQYSYDPETDTLFTSEGKETKENWFSSKLRTIKDPVNESVRVDVEIRKEYDSVIILNTLDYIYGHSFPFLLNLQRLLHHNANKGIIVIIQPMLSWLIPDDGIAEIWTVQLGFRDFNNYHKDLSDKINYQLIRFDEVWLSSAHVLPTNENIKIENFSRIKPYDFSNKPEKPRLTFIWRKDPDRLWIRNIYLVKIFKKLGISFLLFPFHYLRVLMFFRIIKRKIRDKYSLSIAGLDNTGKLPSFIDDRRISRFNEENEKMLCKIYSESELVIGVHGSSMILPSLHAGMVVSLMPSKRWGNFAEDIFYTETDVRLAAFQRRVVPLNLNMRDVTDIVSDMLEGRDSFIKKFIHSDEL